MTVIYTSEKEFQQHQKAIHLIAEQSHENENRVRDIYENFLEKLQVGARCKQFLSVLVTRHVKQHLINARTTNSPHNSK